MKKEEVTTEGKKKKTSSTGASVCRQSFKTDQCLVSCLQSRR